MFLDARCNGEYVRIKNDVGRINANLFGQYLVGAFANIDLAIDGVGLTGLVERHDDNCGAVILDELCLFNELCFALFEADRVHYRLALHALQTRFDNRPLRRVDHDRQARYVRFRGDQVQEGHHRLL